MRSIAFLTLAGLAFAASAGAQTDFTRYVAIGDSITAAFSSGSLNVNYQQTSYPALIYRSATGSTSGFEQPLVTAPGIPAILELRSLQGPVIAPKPGLGSPANLTLPRPYNNLAVPGADVDDVLNRVSDNGGLHDLILRGIGTQLQQAIGLQPTFVSVWIGNNDALGAATSGIVLDGVTLTQAAVFEQKYRTIVGALRSNTSARMVLATIPDVTTIPFVTTIPPVLVNPATRQPVLVNGQLVPLLGPNGPLVPGRDFVLLTASSLLAQGFGIPAALGGNGQPLPDQVLLSGNEAGTISARVNQYNNVIRAVAGETGSALVDVSAEFAEIAAHGLELGGIEITSEFLSGGLFSYDGVHPTAFGYAYLANRFIAAINATHGADLPFVNLGPFLFGDGSAGAPEGPVVSALSVRFSDKAYDNLRWSLGVPKTERLLEIKRRRGEEAPPGPPPGGGPGPLSQL